MWSQHRSFPFFWFTQPSRKVPQNIFQNVSQTYMTESTYSCHFEKGWTSLMGSLLCCLVSTGYNSWDNSGSLSFLQSCPAHCSLYQQPVTFDSRSFLLARTCWGFFCVFFLICKLLNKLSNKLLSLKKKERKEKNTHKKNFPGTLGTSRPLPHPTCPQH